MKDYPTWRCDYCGHLVARDLRDATKPGACKARLRQCPGSYDPDAIIDEEDPHDWEPGQKEKSERGAVTYYEKLHKAKA